MEIARGSKSVTPGGWGGVGVRVVLSEKIGSF